MTKTGAKYQKRTKISYSDSLQIENDIFLPAFVDDSNFQRCPGGAKVVQLHWLLYRDAIHVSDYVSDLQSAPENEQSIRLGQGDFMSFHFRIMG